LPPQKLNTMLKIFTSALLFIALISAFPANAQFGKLKTGVNKLKKAKPEKKTEAKSESKPEESTNDSKPETTKTAAAKGNNLEAMQAEKKEYTTWFEHQKRAVVDELDYEKHTYSEYVAKKNEYLEFHKGYNEVYKAKNGKDHTDSYQQKLIGQLDEYYTSTFPNEILPTAKATIERKTKDCYDKDKWDGDPQSRIKDLEWAENYIEGLKMSLTKPDEELNATEVKVKAQKKKLEEYISSGGLAEHKAEYNAKMIAERKLHKAGMSDASVAATVKSKMDKEKYGTVLRSVITSNSWQIEKDNFGKPKLKFVKVDIATKKSDGKCYYVKGSVARKYEGGGKYGNQYLKIYYTEGEMNCGNVNK